MVELPQAGDRGRRKKLTEVLRYRLEQGKSEETILEQARKNNLPIPSKILNAPRLQTGMAFYYMAFNDLSTCRAVGMSPGPIPWTAIREYAIQYDLDEVDFETLVIVINHMDVVFLEHLNKKKPKK